MNIQRIKKDPRLCQATLGISWEEFSNLIPLFNKSLYETQALQPNRKRKPGGGRRGVLPDAEDKLFFILMYLKTYPTLDVMSLLFNKDRARCCTAVHYFLPVLERALGKKVALPKRQIRSVEEFYVKFPGLKDVFVDGTERKIQRPKQAKRERRHYSGKKKNHTRKNIVVTDETKRILLVSPTKPGRRHDKNCVDRIQLAEHTPKEVAVWGDSGFQGLHHQHPNTLVAKRGRKNKPLTDEEKQENHIISSFRIGVEHAIGGMKRYRCMSDTLRNKIGWFNDKIAVVTAGIWNYHLTSS